MSAAHRTTNGCPRTGAEQAAADRALPRVVGVGTTSQPQEEGRRNNAGGDHFLS